MSPNWSQSVKLSLIASGLAVLILASPLAQARGTNASQATPPPATTTPARAPTLAPNGASGVASKRGNFFVRDLKKGVAVAYQGGGLALGFGERALGKHSPDLGGTYNPVEVKKPPTSTRSVVVFRSNQPKTPEDVASFLEMAGQRGAVNSSQVAFINLRAEKDEDTNVIAKYQSRMPNAAAVQPRQLDVKIIDNAPPAFYVGNAGWKRAVAKIGDLYKVLTDPSIKVAVIHCNEGKGRTGQVVAAAVRVAMDNMSANEALAEAEQHGLTMPWQKAFVERFAKEWKAGKIRFD
jgi:hypothetical protein